MPNLNQGLNPAGAAVTCTHDSTTPLGTSNMNTGLDHIQRRFVRNSITCTGMSDNAGKYDKNACVLSFGMMSTCLSVAGKLYQAADMPNMATNPPPSGPFCWCRLHQVADKVVENDTWFWVHGNDANCSANCMNYCVDALMRSGPTSILGQTDLTGYIE